MPNELKQFTGLLIFGNIENLILAAQGVGAGVNPVGLAALSFCAVIGWFLKEVLNWLKSLLRLY